MNNDIYIIGLAILGAVVNYSAGYVSRAICPDDEEKAKRYKIIQKVIGFVIVASAVVIIMLEGK